MERRAWLTHAELEEQLLSGCAIFVDTNAVHGNQLITLANCIGHWNTVQERAPLRIVVSALVYAERQAQERRHRSAGFDAVKVREFLLSKNIHVLPFEVEDAERTSEFLYTQAPTANEWRDVKLKRLAQALGVAVDSLPKRVSATSDWLIAGHAHSLGALVVTDDKGNEFACVERVKYKRLLDTLNSYLGTSES